MLFLVSQRILKNPVIISYALISKDNAFIFVNKNKINEKGTNITTYLKSIKNEVEIKNQKNAYIKNGVALVKFMYWLEKNVGKIRITEASASDKLEDFRCQQEGFIEPSFDTIAAYKENAAMMHYKPEEGKSNYELKNEKMKK